MTKINMHLGKNLDSSTEDELINSMDMSYEQFKEKTNKNKNSQ